MPGPQRFGRGRLKRLRNFSREAGLNFGLWPGRLLGADFFGADGPDTTFQRIESVEPFVLPLSVPYIRHRYDRSMPPVKLQEHPLSGNSL